MCYRPLHMYNNSRHYDAENMPLYFSCPCGKCEECQNAKRSEWFVRSFYHWHYVRSLGGCGYFYTLTYNDENLPRYNGLPCFNRHDVEGFLKRLKERLRSNFGVHMDYLVCCEFGELYNRPHMHANFYCDKQLMPWTFYNHVNEAWNKGFVYPGQNGGVITSPSGILYTTKYITKDDAFTSSAVEIYNSVYRDYSGLFDFEFSGMKSQKGFPQSFDELVKFHHKFQGDKSLTTFYNLFVRDVRDHSPFNCHSLKFGYSMLSYPDRINYDDETILILQGNKWKPVPLPRYAIRNMFYDRVPNERDGKRNRYVLNTEGIKHYVSILDHRIDEMSRHYEDFFRNTRLSDYQFECMRSHVKFIRGNKDLRLLLDNLDLDFRKLAIYSLVYRNRFSVRDVFDYWKDYKSYFSDCLNFIEDKKLTCISNLSTKDKMYLERNLFNLKPEFFIYEQFIFLYQQMAFLIRKERSSLLYQRRSTERKLRDVIKMSNLKVAI